MSVELVEIGSKLGADETHQQTFQRNRTVKFIARCGLAISVLYVVLYAWLGYEVLAFYNLAFAAFYAAIALLREPGHLRVGGIVLMCGATLHLACTSLLFLPATAGGHFYMILIPVFSLITIHPKDSVWWYLLTIVSLVLIAGLEWQRDTWVPVWALEQLTGDFSGWRAGSAFLAVGLSFGVFRTFHRDLHLARRDLHDSYERSESLLRNMLPDSIAERLKYEQHIIADDVEDASVLFADLVGFTSLAAGQTASETVTMLNAIFSDFDQAVAARGLEKIKTIGDAYMVAAGLPTPRADHAAQLLGLGQELLEILDRHNAHLDSPLRLRVGLASGALVAGVIGSHKLSYDIWGDTVNLASRMESTGVPGRIQVTEAVVQAAADHFTFEDRGPIPIKGKGEMHTFLVVAPT